jgi:hypothetical protein
VHPRPLHQQVSIICHHIAFRLDLSDNCTASVVVVAVHVDQIFKARVFVECLGADMKYPSQAIVALQASKADGWRERKDVRGCDRARFEQHHLFRCVASNNNPRHIRTTVTDQVLANRKARWHIIEPEFCKAWTRQSFDWSISESSLAKGRGTHSVFQYRRSIPVLIQRSDSAQISDSVCGLYSVGAGWKRTMMGVGGMSSPVSPEAARASRVAASCRGVTVLTEAESSSSPSSLSSSSLPSMLEWESLSEMYDKPETPKMSSKELAIWASAIAVRTERAATGGNHGERHCFC